MVSTAKPRTANDRLKGSFNEALAAGLVAATVVHFALFAFFPELTASDWGRADVTLATLTQIDEIPIPPSPEPLARPVAPIAAADVPGDLTIPIIGFLPAAELPPPPPRPGDVTTGRESGFAVYTVAPALLDPEGFQRALLRAYPQAMRDAGIGGRVDLTISIDEEGRVLDASVGGSSGYERLDAVALGLVERMRFSPAMNRDRRVAVTVSVPVEFRVRR